MNFWKKAVCGLLVAALGGMTACSGQGASWAMRSGDVSTPIGLYIIYQIDAAASAESKLAEGDSEGTADRAYKDVLKETVEDQPAAEWMLADAQRQLREYIAVEQKFAEKGLSLTDSDMATARGNVDYTWQYYGEMYESNGVAQSSLQLQMENLLKKNALFLDLYSEGGEYGVTNDELKKTFGEDYVKFSYLLVPRVTADETDENDEVVRTADELDAEAKAKAEDYLKRLDEGTSIVDLVYEYEQETADEGTEVAKRELEELTTIIDDSSGYNPELYEGVKAVAAGKSGLVEDSTYYYVIQRFDILEDPADFESYQATLLSNLKSEEFEAKVTEWGNAVQAEVNQSALDSYKPSRLKIDE